MVLVNVMRGGPGLGNIAPSQGDYNQICKGGGHGDYHPIVLAPASIQEAVDLMPVAFELAHKYLNICCILIDGSIGQMMEPIQLPEMQPVVRKEYDWAVSGAKGRERHILTSIYLDVPTEEKTNLRLLGRWREAQANEIRFKEYYLEDAEYVVIGFGTAGRIALQRSGRRGQWVSRWDFSARSASVPSPSNAWRHSAESAVHPGGGDEHRADAQGCPGGGPQPHPDALLRALGRRGAFPG